MASLSINLLGTFQVAVGGRQLSFATDKCRALLAYLAVEANRPHRRQTLAGLLWPEKPEAVARANLRQTLHRLLATLEAVSNHSVPLIISYQDIQFHQCRELWLDIAEFRASLGAYRSHCGQGLPLCSHCLEALKRAASLYQGDFMAGFSLSDSPPFEVWQLSMQERYHRQATEILTTLGGFFEGIGSSNQAARYAHRLIDLEPWRESYHRLLMRNLVKAGQRQEALACYERCRKLLVDELGVEPSAETTRLFKNIVDGVAVGE